MAAAVLNVAPFLVAELAPSEGRRIEAFAIHRRRARRECWIVARRNREAPMCLEMARKARCVAVRPEANGRPHSANEIIEIACVHGGRPITVFDDRKSPAPEERTIAPIAWGHVG